VIISNLSKQNNSPSLSKTFIVKGIFDFLCVKLMTMRQIHTLNLAF